jgi:hypothetical protein
MQNYSTVLNILKCFFFVVMSKALVFVLLGFLGCLQKHAAESRSIIHHTRGENRLG